MNIGDLKTEKGVKDLNVYLLDKSYISGYQPSQDDVTAFNALSKAPGPDTPNALRWYNHIKSYNNEERKKFPAGTGFAGSNVNNVSNGKGDEEDDVDLFASDEEATWRENWYPSGGLIDSRQTPRKGEKKGEMGKSVQRSFGKNPRVYGASAAEVEALCGGEDKEAEKLREERLKLYAEKKSKKPAVVAKSSIILDVKPWDDETDMQQMEKSVRSIEMDGLVWGLSKLVPVGYGINKLQIVCVVEDDKVSVDLLVEKIQEFEDHVQSVDIAAFNKI